MATEPEICNNCNKIVSRGNEFTFGTDCYCNFPIELTNLCQNFVDKENKVPVLNLEHIKEFREHGTFPQELTYTTYDIEEDPRDKRPLPKTPAKPPRNLHLQDSLDESQEDVDDTVRTLRQALEDATKELALSERRYKGAMDALEQGNNGSREDPPAVNRFQRNIMISYKNSCLQ